VTNGPLSFAGKQVVVVRRSFGSGFAVAELARTLVAIVLVASNTRPKVDAALKSLEGATWDVVDRRM
jgi:hypothetical protein